MSGGIAVKPHPYPTSRSLRRRLATGFREVLRNRIALVGLVVVVVQVAAAALAPVLLAFPPDAIDYRAMLQEPGWVHWLGTDDLGRDILSRLIYGARLLLLVSTVAVALAVVVGLPLGLVSGYVGGWVDEVLMRLLDSIM